ncbi:RagB/SusD family nutrient uptake outer membrane protein [Bacteroides sp. 214]|uniref:RagB/SusD family nutrient uptake outer membrane protein n=1 Tax=Bacteroides sp. 214 TaxID=2302935 RepID=UPI0013D1295D|nr:RagB/SusD family nutrient uptake outer membrane protein [Bacteroides sp. 214]NDW11481.1 RagB/SusD family nutrient uptake outer membrane protein [Bacteroides sp. 214]
MKRIIYIAKASFMIGVCLALTSCEDFLTSAPSNLLSSDGFYQTPSQSEQGIVGVYAGLYDMALLEHLYLSECRSDNAWVTPKTNGFREYSEIGTFRADYSLSTFDDVWNKWYKIIYDANVALAKIPSCDFGTRDDFKNQLLGEAHFLRGWAYFEMVRLFGNIPLIDKPLSPDEVKNIKLSPEREIYDKIIVPDLIEAKTILPINSEMKNASTTSIAGKGRADKIAAQAMLGRVYMTMAGFPLNDSSAQALAETELKAVITFSEGNNNMYWAPDSTEWRKQFLPADAYYNKYPIFSIQYRAGGTGNKAIFYFGPTLPTSYATYNIFGNGIYVEKSLMYEFDKVYTQGDIQLRDARGYDYSILSGFDAEPNFPEYSKSIDKLTLEGGSVVDVQSNAMFYKFMPSKHKINALGMTIDYDKSMSGNQDWPVNHPVLRYEDVLLMYAEILVSKSDVAGAMNIVNRIRQRAGCAPESTNNATEALKFVKRERRIELMGEGVRWFDLVRWNEWKGAIENMFDSYNNPDGIDKANVKEGRYLYPIPMDQVNVKPGLYNQNTGY